MTPAEMLDSGRVALNISETAWVLGVDRRGVGRAVAAGELPSLRVGARVLVPVAALRQLLGLGPNPPPHDEAPGVTGGFALVACPEPPVTTAPDTTHPQGVPNAS